MLRILIAGLAGGMTLNLSMLLTFRLLGFGWQGKGILLTSPLQSPKLVAVWMQLEPLPLVVAKPLPILLGMLAFGIGHACLYHSVRAAWPAGTRPRALRLAAVVFGVCFVFWEFFTPFNLFGEAPALIALELLFWGIIALAEAFVIVGICEYGQNSEK